MGAQAAHEGTNPTNPTLPRFAPLQPPACAKARPPAPHPKPRPPSQHARYQAGQGAEEMAGGGGPLADPVGSCACVGQAQEGVGAPPTHMRKEKTAWCVALGVPPQSVHDTGAPCVVRPARFGPLHTTCTHHVRVVSQGRWLSAATVPRHGAHFDEGGWPRTSTEKCAAKQNQASWICLNNAVSRCLACVLLCQLPPRPPDSLGTGSVSAPGQEAVALSVTLSYITLVKVSPAARVGGDVWAGSFCFRRS